MFLLVLDIYWLKPCRNSTSLMAQNITPAPPPIPTANSFNYQPLILPRTIRILTLYQGSGDTPLEGSLTVESLDSDPSYEAVSYVWGTLGRSCHLSVEGEILSLTQSIHDALSRVRHPVKARRLWADQICINQDDIAERGQQVQFMNAIYKNAERVLVWLGRDNEGIAEAAVETVNHLETVFADEVLHERFMKEHSENLVNQSQEPWIPLSKLSKLSWVSAVYANPFRYGQPSSAGTIDQRTTS